MAFDSHVTVGGGHYDAYGNQAYDNHVTVGGGHGGSPNLYVPNDTDYKSSYVYANNVPRACVLTVSNDDSRAWTDREQEHLDKSWDIAKSMAQELGLGYGSLKSGDIQGTYEHGLNAALKSAEMLWEDTKHSWNSITEIFKGTVPEGPDRDK